jgi:hypothetical protein
MNYRIQMGHRIHGTLCNIVAPIVGGASGQGETKFLTAAMKKYGGFRGFYPLIVNTGQISD